MLILDKNLDEKPYEQGGSVRFDKRNIGWKPLKYMYVGEAELRAMCGEYKEGSLRKTPKEKLYINPKVAYHVSDHMIASNIPYNWIDEKKDLYGIVSRLSTQSPVDNLLWDYLFFTDSSVFRPSAITFEKSQRNVIGTAIKPSYTTHVKGTKAYYDFWEQEFNRITEGYEPIVDGKPCGVRISGEFYFYLNYTRIEKIIRDETGAEKSINGFPDFLVMDYYYYKELEARENPQRFGLHSTYKKSLVVAKSRRKGLTLKAAAGCVWIIAFNNNVRVGIASEANSNDETDAVKCAKKVIPIIDWISNHTPFGRTEIGKPQENGGWKHQVTKHTKSQFSLTLGIFNTRTGEKRGRQSTVFTMTTSKDDSASGEGISRLYFEEAGKIHNLNKSWVFARETLKAGSLFRGIAIIFGCVTKNMKVWTPEGKLISVKEIKANNKLLGYNGDNVIVEEAVYIQPPAKKECYRITTDKQNIIECSDDHPIMWSHRNYRYHNREIKNGKRIELGTIKKAAFQEAEYIKVGDQIAVADIIDIFGKKQMWNPRLIGLLIGDGSYGFDKTPVLANCDDDVNLYVESNFDTVIEKFYKTKDNKDYKELRIRGITKNLRDLGIYGQSKCNKKLPEDIHMYNKESICELLGGFYDADGTISCYENKKGNTFGSITLTSACENLLKEVKNVFLKLGVHGTIITVSPDINKNKRIKDRSYCYRFVISDILSINRFYNNITLFCKNKHDNLEKLYLSRKYKHTKTVMVHSKGSRNKAKLEELSNIRFETVKKIEKIGLQKIYNIGAGETHTYLANNFITHNTGGEMVSSSGKDGSSRAFRDLFYNPAAGELGGYMNIYEYREEKKEAGYFICDMWSNFGSYIIYEGERILGLDEQGNALFWVAELSLNQERLQKQNGPRENYNKFLTQRCKTPSEAFLVGEGSVFNVTDLLIRRNEIKTSRGGFDKLRTAGELYESSDGTVGFKPDIEGLFTPITSFSYDRSNREGCLLIYEHPRGVYGSIPEDAYIITVDTIGKDTDGGESLNAVIVLKTPKYSGYIGKEKIVATYFGRRKVKPLSNLHTLLYKLSKYYNAQITFENDQDGGVLNYFASRNMLNRLMPSPMMVTKKHIPTSKTLLREFGHSMSSDRHKSFGEQYTNEWLDYRHGGNMAVDSNDNAVRQEGIRNLDLLEDEFIIESLINYNRKGNYDAVLALMGGIIQFQERFLDQDFKNDPKDYSDKMTDQLMEYYFERFKDTYGYQEWKSNVYSYKFNK